MRNIRASILVLFALCLLSIPMEVQSFEATAISKMDGGLFLDSRSYTSPSNYILDIGLGDTHSLISRAGAGTNAENYRTYYTYHLYGSDIIWNLYHKPATLNLPRVQFTSGDNNYIGGKLKIGAASDPGEELDVLGNATISGTISAGGASISGSLSANTAAVTQGLSAGSVSTGSVYPNGQELAVGSVGYGNSIGMFTQSGRALTIGTDNKVGIGTSAPNANLHIFGIHPVAGGKSPSPATGSKCPELTRTEIHCQSPSLQLDLA